MKINFKSFCDRKLIIYTFCLALSFLFLFFCSKSSPFYSMNDWCDANTFFTLGKSLTKGRVIYKDIFEQKGPLIYFIHALSYLISNKTFLGVFIFEVLSFSVFLYFINKIVKLFCKKENIFWILPLISFIILSSFVFCSGDSAEEFCIMFLSISLYHLLNYFKNTYPKNMDKKDIIINGIMAGCVLWMKYTMLGFWIGFIFPIILNSFINKRIKEAFISALYFLLGMIIVTIPFIIYFAFNNTLYDFFYTYFYINLNAYSSKVPLFNRILNALIYALGYAKHLPIFTVFSIFGYLFFMINKKVIPNIYGKIALTCSILLTVLGVYFGSNYRYYFLFIMPFCILGLISLGILIDKIKLRKYIYILSPIIIIVIAFIIVFNFNHNISYYKTVKNKLPQYEIANYINKDSDQSLLYYNCIDQGIHTLLGTIPSVKYYSCPNIAYEDMPIILDSQNKYIKDKVVKYVLIIVDKDNYYIDIPHLEENYQKAFEIDNYQNNETYVLFEKKD